MNLANEYNTALALERGKGDSKNGIDAARRYKELADAGHLRAMDRLGKMYQDGRGVEQNDTLAAEWFRKSAEGGDAAGQLDYGWVFAQGRGVVKNEELAFAWYLKSAEQGNSTAQCNVGMRYESGKGVEKDDYQARKWFHCSAVNGNARGQYRLGLICERREQLYHAQKLFQQASVKGNELAKKKLKDDHHEQVPSVSRDVLVVYCEATFEIANIIGDDLHKRGYTVSVVANEEYRVGACIGASVVMPVIAGNCAVCDLLCGDPVVPVWPNNRDRPEEDYYPYSTLEMNGTDYECSLDKACGRFPEKLQRKIGAINSSIKTGAWDDLLVENPELEDLCPFSELSGTIWRLIMLRTSKYESRCDWNKLSGFDWAELLSEKPEYAKHCVWTKLDGGNWAVLLSRQPQLETCYDWAKLLTNHDWERLIRFQPHFRSKCDLSTFDGSDWAYLLLKQPQFANECNWEILNGENWCVLLEAKPEFANKCDWGKFNGREWKSILIERPEFADKCDWSKLNGQDWIELLSKRPEFATRCNWDLLYGVESRYWHKLLAHQPCFIDKCDVAKVDCCRDMFFLNAFPELARKCDWTTINGKVATYVLEHHPELSDKCDWGRLEDEDWDALLKVRPEFEVFRTERRSVCDEGRGNTDVDSVDLLFDVVICSTERGREAAKRLGEALERRMYSVYVAEDAEDCTAAYSAIDRSKYFLIMRSEGLFAELQADNNPQRLQIEYARRVGKQFISVGISDQKWQESIALPATLMGLETDQVKNLDMDDLFEEKVDAIIRESIRSDRGSLATKYDVFISYRRLSGDALARRLHQELKRRGYLAFLDYDCILNGKYDKVIISAIGSAPVFLSLLTESSLDRCAGSGDWVCAEIQMALEQKKCLLTLSPDNQEFKFPQDLPAQISEIKKQPRYFVNQGENFESTVSAVVSHFPEELQRKAREIVGVLQSPERSVGTGETTPIVCDNEILAKKAYVSFSGSDGIQTSPLSRLLTQYPDAIYLSSYRDFSGDDWCATLVALPEMAIRCDWGKLCPFHYVDILTIRPGLVDWCDLAELDGWNWMKLLQKRPELSGRCQWKKLSGEEWRYLLEKQPQFAQQCPWVDPYRQRDLAFNDQMPDRFVPLALVLNKTLMEDFKFRSRFKSLLRLARDGRFYRSDVNAAIFTAGGEFISYVNPCAFALYHQPELSVWFNDEFDKFSGKDRCVLLMRRPEFIDRWSMKELSSRESECWVGAKDNEFDCCWRDLVASNPRFSEFYSPSAENL